jgi:hypothetical protein
MSGAGAVHRLEQRWMLARGIDVGRGRDADRPGAGGAQVAQDVAEQVARDDGVEELRPLHEVRGQDVDVEAIGP